MFPDMYPPHCNDAEHRHHDDTPPPMSLPSQFSNALGFIAEEPSPQQTSLVGHNMPSVPSTPSHASPRLTAPQLPTPYRATFQLPTTVPAGSACTLSSW
ncbi:hypothetical protein BC827DRAFT_1175209 [Russula dissimulans]|nr:hypothetical protein BC827DRAFT_1175209 [Russula dissimulans]